MSASEIVNKVWNYAHVLRDDGVGYLPALLRSAQARGDYVEAAPGILPPAAFEHPCSSQLPMNEVPHECV